MLTTAGGTVTSDVVDVGLAAVGAVDVGHHVVGLWFVVDRVVDRTSSIRSIFRAMAWRTKTIRVG